MENKWQQIIYFRNGEYEGEFPVFSAKKIIYTSRFAEAIPLEIWNILLLRKTENGLDGI